MILFDTTKLISTEVVILCFSFVLNKQWIKISEHQETEAAKWFSLFNIKKYHTCFSL